MAFGTNHSPIGEVGSFLRNVKKCVLIPCREYSHGLPRAATALSETGGIVENVEMLL